jgi:hypothetical protein
VRVAKGDIGKAKEALTTAYNMTVQACGRDTPLSEQARQLMLNPPQVVFLDPRTRNPKPETLNLPQVVFLDLVAPTPCPPSRGLYVRLLRVWCP